jgi:hypothetical protein
MIIFGGDDEIQKLEYLLKTDWLCADMREIVGDIL